jgi:hypothetical protein
MDYTKIKIKMDEYLTILEKLLDKNHVPSISEVLDIDKKIKSVSRVAIEDDSILKEYDKSVNANELLDHHRPSHSRISSDLIIENDSDIINRRAKLATMKIYLTSFKEEIELRESIEEKSTKLEKIEKRTKEEVAEAERRSTVLETKNLGAAIELMDMLRTELKTRENYGNDIIEIKRQLKKIEAFIESIKTNNQDIDKK